MEKYIYSNINQKECFMNIIIKLLVLQHIETNYYHYNKIKVLLFYGILLIINKDTEIFM